MVFDPFDQFGLDALTLQGRDVYRHFCVRLFLHVGFLAIFDEFGQCLFEFRFELFTFLLWHLCLRDEIIHHAVGWIMDSRPFRSGLSFTCNRTTSFDLDRRGLALVN